MCRVVWVLRFLGDLARVELLLGVGIVAGIDVGGWGAILLGCGLLVDGFWDWEEGEEVEGNGGKEGRIRVIEPLLIGIEVVRGRCLLGGIRARYGLWRGSG